MSSLYVATEIGVVRLARSELGWSEWHQECGDDCPASANRSTTRWHVFHSKTGLQDHQAGTRPLSCDLCQTMEHGDCSHPMFKMGTLLVKIGVAKWADWLSNSSGDLADTDLKPTIDKMPVIDALDPKNYAVKRTLYEALRRAGYEGDLP